MSTLELKITKYAKKKEKKTSCQVRKQSVELNQEKAHVEFIKQGLENKSNKFMMMWWW